MHSSGQADKGECTHVALSLQAPAISRFRARGIAGEAPPDLRFIRRLPEGVGLVISDLLINNTS